MYQLPSPQHGRAQGFSKAPFTIARTSKGIGPQIPTCTWAHRRVAVRRTPRSCAEARCTCTTPSFPFSTTKIGCRCRLGPPHAQLGGGGGIWPLAADGADSPLAEMAQKTANIGCHVFKADAQKRRRHAIQRAVDQALHDMKRAGGVQVHGW
uniref:Uncharacterized protein n=1 Tax=Eutreptiella gymnastica TaxID=73025 RepID=A0A7S4FZ13_9EUGL